MAGKNDKPKEPSLTTKTPSERRLKVSSMLVQRGSKTSSWHGAGKTEVQVPWIRMQGKWLQEAGFEIHKWSVPESKDTALG